MKMNFLLYLISIFIVSSCVQDPTKLDFSEESTSSGFGQGDTPVIDGGGTGGSGNAPSSVISQIIVQNNCTSCHTTGYQYGDFTIMQEDSDWIDSGLVVAADPDSSFLISKLKNSNLPISTMPPTASISDEDYQTLRNIITNLSTSDANTDPVEDATESETLVNLGTMNFFLNQMNKVFGVQNNAKDNKLFAIMNITMIDLWGGKCDFYNSTVQSVEGNNSDGVIWDTPHSVCSYNAQTAKDKGDHSVIKAGVRIHLCERIVHEDRYLNSFYSKILNNQNDFNFSNAEKTFNLFYPTITYNSSIHQSFTNALSANSSGSVSNNDTWRAYLSTLCQSLYWEIH